MRGNWWGSRNSMRLASVWVEESAHGRVGRGSDEPMW
jgi:hypothetical protein